MKSFDYVIKDELGIHARPAGMLVKEAKKFQSAVTISHNEQSAQATKLMSIMALGVKQGDTVTISAEGADEDVAITALETFMGGNL
jgi:phosphocarrier protein